MVTDNFLANISIFKKLSSKHGRLAAYVLYFSDRKDKNTELELDITKGQLASLLGTIPETISRIFSRMSNQRLIHINGRNIRLLNKKALKEIAEEGKLSI
jgi:CRP-like cAMP-binding protein